MISKLSIRTKLILTFVIVGTSPLIVSNLISYLKSTAEIDQQAAERAKLVAVEKTALITSYFSKETSALVDLATSHTTSSALEEFAAPFEQETHDASVEKSQAHREVLKFYTEQFGTSYLEKAKKNIGVESLVDKLDELSLVAQYDFIATNDYPLGKKDQLTTPKRASAYSSTHQKYHSFFREYLLRHELYDLFLVNTQGRVVYTVFKETDFATSLRQGPWAQTNLAKAFENSIKLETGKVHLEDFAAYPPSYEAPAAFAATPIYKGGKIIGSLMIQLPLNKISDIANNRDGLGLKGETLLLGSDLKLRADTFRNKSTHNVAASFEENSKIHFDTDAITKVKAGETGYLRNVSYDGTKTLSYYLPVKIENLTWYVITELAEDEVYAGLNEITYYTLGILLIGVFGIAVAAFLFGSSIAKSLKNIALILNRSSQEVSTASSQSASSATQLSEASTEQAASLQETMASVEEISAMVNQNADSAAKTQTAVSANQRVAEEGSLSVDDMLRAISDIKETNDDILTQMEVSNKEFSEIVKIISEIGEKTEVINEIVFQTKLLSFNASVEAARAGEHGKGFAVVAEEVGNLAQMSGNAAKEITDMLSDSIKKVNGIVESTKTRVDQLIETGKDKIAMGQSKAEKCRDALSKINQNAKSIAAMTTEIAHASKEQSQGIQEINKAISQLDQVTQQNSAVAQQSSTQAEQLNTEAISLSKAVNHLVLFVEGSQKEYATTEHSTGEEKAKQDPATLSKVLSFNKKKSDAGKSVQTAKHGYKKAAGTTEAIPNSNDPKFEEF